MKIVYFVRHGQSQANVDGVFAGCLLDSPLTTKGLEQADLTAEVLRGKTFDVIVSSSLLRAKSTAERIAKRLDYDGSILIEPLLQERDFGEATGKPWGSAAETQIDDGTAKGLETIEQLAERMQRLLDWFDTVPGESILAVGHGTAEAMLQTIYTGRPFATFLQTEELGNAEVREYRIGSDQLQ
jgi:probable phosphoglycerate mutase